MTLLEQEHFTGSMPFLTHNYIFWTCGGPEASTSTTICQKCGEKASSGGQERYILKTHPYVLHLSIIVVEITALGPPHILMLWLVVGKGTRKRDTNV